MKNILVAVTGASPQVLTETVYALHMQGKPIPEEVFVITTKTSKQMLVEGLFDKGEWQKLLDEYEMARLIFLKKISGVSPMKMGLRSMMPSLKKTKLSWRITLLARLPS